MQLQEGVQVKALGVHAGQAPDGDLDGCPAHAVPHAQQATGGGHGILILTGSLHLPTRSVSHTQCHTSSNP